MGAILPNSYVQGFLPSSLYQGSLKGVCSPLLNCYACPSALFSCPIGTLQHFMVTGNVPYYGIGTLSVTGASVGRMTCGTVCPFGFLQDLLYKFRGWKAALFSLFNKSSVVQLAWNPDSCTRCGKCQKICPVDIRPDRNWTDPDCLRCLDCTRCPSLKLTTVFHRQPFGEPAVPASA